MIVDCHSHIWPSPEQLGPGALPDLARPMVFGRERIRLLPKADTASHHILSEPAGRCFVLGFRSRYLGADIPNQFLADYCGEHADQMVGFAGIDPTEDDACRQVRQITTESNLKGITLCPAAQDFHPCDTRAMEVYEAAAERKLPIIFDHGVYVSPQIKLEYGRPILLDEVARNFPNLKILIADMGYPWIDETFILLAKHANLYADISAMLQKPWIAYDALVRAWQHQIDEKICFGSDFPFSDAATAVNTLYHLNFFAQGTNLPVIPREVLRSIVERDVPGILGIHLPTTRIIAAPPKSRPNHRNL